MSRKSLLAALAYGVTLSLGLVGLFWFIGMLMGAVLGGLKWMGGL